jgi:hypothetical protein
VQQSVGILRKSREVYINQQAVVGTPAPFIDQPAQKLMQKDRHCNLTDGSLCARMYSQGGYQKKFPTLAELACEGMWWAVRNLARHNAASLAEYQEVFHGKTAAQWAQHYGLPDLSREIEYYVRDVAAWVHVHC